MKVVAIMGSYRKGKTVDTLVERALDGVREADPGAQIEKISLVEKDIGFCRNCGMCRRDDPEKPIARCAIQDDMQEILPLMREGDAYLCGSPIFEGTVNALTKGFLERICWTLARPGRWPVRGCPKPRIDEKKRAAVILSSGLIVPLFRWFCDDATSLLKSTFRDSLGAKLVGSLYAGGVEKVGVDRYLDRAFRLGRRLVE